jgi:hypothetical protein
MKEGKSLDDIKNEVKMAEYADWGSQERLRPTSTTPIGHWQPIPARSVRAGQNFKLLSISRSAVEAPDYSASA